MGRARTLLTLAGLGLSTLTLSACGAAGAASVVAAPAGAERAAQPPAQILAQMGQALKRVRSYHVDGTGVDASGHPMTVSGDFVAPNRVDMTVTDAARVVSIRLAGRYAYFYEGSASPASGRWFRVRAAALPKTDKGLVNAMKPTSLVRCNVPTGHAKITVAGHTTIDGVPIVILDDHGNVARSQRGMIYVAATGPALPLKLTTSAPERRGGGVDRVCGSRNDQRSSSLTVTDINWPIRIGAPSGVVFPAPHAR